MKNNKNKILAITATFIALATQASGAAANNAHMQLAGLTSQPIGHYNYCKQYYSDCTIKSNNTKAPELTRKRWEEMVSVNSYSNLRVTPVTDLEAYNKEELWAYPVSYGDCEDYVLMKRHMLMQRGWPASALLITVVRQPNGEGHAVLTVRTSRADYVLDNLNNKIKPWNATGYKYLKRQSIRHSGHWTKIMDKRG